MDAQFYMILAITGPLFTFFIVYGYFRLKTNGLRHALVQMTEFKSALQLELDQEKKLLLQCQEKNQYNEKVIVKLRTELTNAQDRLIEEVHNEEKQAQRFENIANNILRSQSQLLNDRHTKGMRDILEPLKERIRNFEAKVEVANKQSLERHVSLKEQIHSLSKQSEQVSQDANNLAKALKGDFKTQGNWGEIILNSILEKSGLEKDREYFLQETGRNDQGRLLKPDVVIHLPDEKRLIIDSKVSLVSYDRMLASENAEEQKRHQRAHAQALRNHVTSLSTKNYHDLYKMRSPDFVMMFVPIDTALSSALYIDPKLYDDAFNRNIILVTSSTLLATLKTVETLWRNEKQNRYALKIAEEAGKMYDKFVGFAEDMDKLGLQLGTVQKTYNASMKKLSSGSGNLLKKAELVRSLGAKANKQMPQKMLG